MSVSRKPVKGGRKGGGFETTTWAERNAGAVVYERAEQPMQAQQPAAEQMTEETEEDYEEEIDEDEAPDFVDPDNLDEDCTVVADLDDDDGVHPPTLTLAPIQLPPPLWRALRLAELHHPHASDPRVHRDAEERAEAAPSLFACCRTETLQASQCAGGTASLTARHGR
jgi:hypothetical protein